MKSFAISLLGRWKPVLGGVIAALLLLPVPALALTFTGHWKAAIQRSGIPLPPKPKVADVTNNAAQKDTLTVNMGNYTGRKGKAVSSIILTRGFTISAASQTIQLNETFATELVQAGAQVVVAVRNANGRVVATPFVFRTNFPRTPFLGFVPVGGKAPTNTFTLKKGRYTFDVRIKYRTDNKHGRWKTKSPHKFEFIGV
jgi:hypothetical protein